MTEKLAFTIGEVVTACRISRTAIYRAIADGSLTARKRGSRTLILAVDLERWLKALPIVPRSAA